MKKIFLILLTLISTINFSFALTLNGNEVNFSKDLESISNQSKYENYTTILVKFKEPLTAKQKENFFEQNIEAIEYAGDLAYYLYAKNKYLVNLLNNISFIGIANVKSIYKASGKILNHALSEHAVDNEGNYLLNVILLKNISELEINNIFSNNNIAILQTINQRAINIKLNPGYLNELLNMPIIQHIEEAAPPLKEIINTTKQVKKARNHNSANLLNVRELQNEDYNLTGEGIKIAIVDGGNIRDTHIEFMNDDESRVQNMSDNCDLSEHSTHVAGTITAKGERWAAKGIAYSSLIYGYCTENISYADSLLKAYYENEVLLSNHSYGYSTEDSLGEYDFRAYYQDKVIYENPYIVQFIAAGNERTTIKYIDYGLIKGAANSKNNFTIGAVDDLGTEVLSFSNFGPVNDGRIKPDLVANGDTLLSTGSDHDEDYIDFSGTSMAAPSATGAAALIMEQFKKETNGDDIRTDIIKALMINSAKDLGNKGPDYSYGYGLIDAKKAVDTLKTLNVENSLIKTDTVEHNQIIAYKLNLTSESQVKITLSWIDPPANPGSDKTLVNDIDMWLVGKSSTYYPFSLDKNIPEKEAASDNFNKTDNTEQISASLNEGEYILYIIGDNITTTSQDFAIVSSQPITKTEKNILNIFPNQIDFKNGLIGIEQSEEITLQNLGDSELYIENITIDNNEVFTIDFNKSSCGESFPLTLESRDQCTLNIISKPADNETQSANIIIETLEGKRIINLLSTVNEDKPSIVLHHTQIYDFKNNNSPIDTDNNWYIGDEQLKSETIMSNRKTDYDFNKTVYKNGSIALDYSISSEAYADYFEFYINSVRNLNDSGNKQHQNFSTNLDETKLYNFKFRYYKNILNSLYDDNVKINTIKIKKAKVENLTFTDVSTISDTKILTIENFGSKELMIENVFTSDEDHFKLDFNLSESSCKNRSFALAPLEKCTFGVYFSTDNIIDSFSGSLTIVSNDKNASNLTIPLQANSIILYDNKKPTNLKAEYAGSKMVSLTWEDNSDFEIGYKIYRNGLFIHQTKANITSYMDEGVKPGNSYLYEIKTVYQTYESDSIELEVTTMNDVPNVPTKLTSQKITNNTVLLNWQDNSSDELGFIIYRDGELIKKLPSNSTYFTDTNLEASTEYTYQVAAYNDFGETKSIDIFVTTLRPISDEFIKNINVQCSPREVKFSWEINSEDFNAILIYKNDSLLKIVSNTAELQDTDVVPDTKYIYKLIATNGIIYSNPIDIEVNTKYENKPNEPSNIRAINVESRTLTIKWDDNSYNETSFEIYRDFKHIATVKPNETEYIDIDLSPDTTYFYQVVAHNGSNFSKSTYTYLKTKDEISLLPNQPSNLTILEEDDKFILSWEDNSDNETGFHIYKDFKLYYTTENNTETFSLTNPHSEKRQLYQVVAFNERGSSRSTYIYY